LELSKKAPAQTSERTQSIVHNPSAARPSDETGKTMPATCGCRGKASFAKQNFCVPGFACLPGERLCGRKALALTKALLVTFVATKVTRPSRGYERADYSIKNKFD
jgi:hypothetical protein